MSKDYKLAASNLNELTDWLIDRPTNEELLDLMRLNKPKNKSKKLEIEKSLQMLIKKVNDNLKNYDISQLSLDEAHSKMVDFVSKTEKDLDITENLYLSDFKKILDNNWILIVILQREVAKYCLKYKNYNEALLFYCLTQDIYKFIFLDIKSLTPSERKHKKLFSTFGNLPKKIWDKDSNHILFPIQVARLAIEITDCKMFSENEVLNYVKRFEIPKQITERIKNNDYGNTINERKAREELILKIKKDLR